MKKRNLMVDLIVDKSYFLSTPATTMVIERVGATIYLNLHSKPFGITLL